VNARPRVLMVTGNYFPETSGASLQCRQLIRALSDQVDFAVLTTSTDFTLPSHSVVDNVLVRRVAVDVTSPVSKAIAFERMASSFIELASDVPIIHLHGFSQKNLLVVALARLLGKRIVIKLTSIGHDDPVAIKARGRAASLAYAQADAFIGVSPRFVDEFVAHGLDPRRFTFIPNGVDLDRFRPAVADEKQRLRRELGLRAELPMIVFVGFFSREKRPDVLFEAWADLFRNGRRSTLVMIGATAGQYYEIDPELAPAIRRRAADAGLSDHLVFVERTDRIEDYYRAADVFALPTLREGLPNVLLESMASGIVPVITRLEGVTDWIVTPGETGELVPPSDPDALSSALDRVLADPERSAVMAAAARAHVAAHFGMPITAQRTLALYQGLLARDS